LLISILACIGCTQLLNYLARKYLVERQQLHQTVTLSNTWLFIIGTLTNHCKDDTIHYTSVKPINFCVLAKRICSCKRISQSSKICKNSGNHLASGDICFRQYLFLVHGFIHVAEVPATRCFYISRFGYESKLQANYF